MPCGASASSSRAKTTARRSPCSTERCARGSRWRSRSATQAAPKNVMRLELRAVAADGPAATVKLLPWSVRIPHEEVVFETGKWDVRPSEEAKLHASYQRIVDAVAVARKSDPTLNVRVFI